MVNQNVPDSLDVKNDNFKFFVDLLSYIVTSLFTLGLFTPTRNVALIIAFFCQLPFILLQICSSNRLSVTYA